MNDELMLCNYLMILKSTVEVYVHGTIESSNDEVRDVLKLGLDETLKHQAKLYDEMVSYDYYQVDNINPDDIKCVYDSLNQKN